MTHEEKALQLLHQRYHCAQALFGAFAEDFGLDLKTALKISTCFGGGMRQGGLCGCVTGALLVLGLAMGFWDVHDRELEVYGNQKTKEFLRAFSQRMEGKMDCRDILGLDISKPCDMAELQKSDLMHNKCPNAVRVSIEILEDLLSQYHTSDLQTNIGLDEIHNNADALSTLKRASLRRKFKTNVSSLLFSSKRNIAFIQFDISRFKIINDLYGEKFGDQILEFMNQQLKEFCKKNQFYTNIRSDVFMIVMEFDEKDEITAYIESLDEQINLFNTVPLQISYGVYIVQDRHMEQRRMEDRSAMARKVAKDGALTNIAFYQDKFKDTLYNRKFVEENIHSAIVHRQIMMYLQPKFSITQNRIVGAEALVRWRHPERGMIFPDQFIPIVEENGFVQEIDYFIWEEACQFLRRCTDAGISPCPISVNVSRIHLRDNTCIEVLSEMVERNGISKALLELEITETAGGLQIRKKATELKSEGFTLLMDDFGSGYSSLNVLLETPFDVIKLDKKFMENMVLSNKGLLILEQVVSMANKLELGLLAEGVETQEQIDLLRSIGCDQVQGYYYAKPMPAEEFYKMLYDQEYGAVS